MAGLVLQQIDFLNELPPGVSLKLPPEENSLCLAMGYNANPEPGDQKSRCNGKCLKMKALPAAAR